MMILSMLTNSLIVGFSSEQLAVWCPWMYETIDGDQFIKVGYGRHVFDLGHVFFLYHCNTDFNCKFVLGVAGGKI